MTRRQDDATRRQIFKTGLALVGGVLTLPVQAPTPAKAQQKLAPAMVQYQTTPKNGQKCVDCANFEAPRACKIVSGDIAPEGWCIAFGPKT